MAIDILFALAMLAAIIKGYRTGFIVGLFSFIAYYIGLAAALKLSATVAKHFSKGGETHSLWMPVLSFLLVFIVVVLIVNVVARLLKSVASLTFLGWFDKAGGALLFIIIYIFIFSILIFYAVKISLFGTETVGASKVYPYIEPIAPKMIGFLGKILPFFGDLFKELQSYLGRFS